MKRLAVGSVSFLPVAAMAAVPTEVTDALTAAEADVATVAGGVLLVVVAIFGFLMIRKALR